MFTMEGKYGKDCKVFTDMCDNAMIGQINSLLNHEASLGSKIRIMPDCHAGKGCVIGTTMTITDKAVPNLVGVDIGCGMYAVRLKEKRIDLPKLDSVIQSEIPSGFAIHQSAKAESNIGAMKCAGHVDIEKGMRSLGTLGGGNHFLEVDRDMDGSLWLIIHTGSRYLGLEVCNYYQEKGFNRLKEEGISTPYELAYLQGDDLEDYLFDTSLVCWHAIVNRETIAKTITKKMKLHMEEAFHTVHNYIDYQNKMLRKGAISATKGEKLLIPLNMRDGAVICTGKGNDDWNQSAPHGAGRLMSRSDAKESISMSDYRKSMEGIYTSCIMQSTVDESPMAYKDANAILSAISETAEVVSVLKPIYNFKAC